MRSCVAILTTVIGAALAAAGTAGATTFYLSTDAGAPGTTMGTPPLTFPNGSVAQYDDATDTATLFFDEALFGAPENLDAFELLPNGHMLLSTTSPASLPGITGNFGNGDVVEWDPVNSVASIFFNDSLFTGGGSTNTDGVAIHPNGHILLSTTDPQTLGSLTFRDGDIVEWDGTTAILFFSEDLFGSDPLVNTDEDVNVDAFDVAEDGRLVLSTFENDVSLGGVVNFRNGDLVAYDISTDTATIIFNENLFASGNEDIDAVAVPEPSASALLALGLLGLAFVGGRGRA